MSKKSSKMSDVLNLIKAKVLLKTLCLFFMLVFIFLCFIYKQPTQLASYFEQDDPNIAIDDKVNF